MMITTKGQVTIPKEFRDLCGLHPHTEVEFTLKHGELVVHPASKPLARGSRIVEALRGKGDISVNTDEIMRLTRGEG